MTLQRDTVEVGGNIGQITIGKLPDGVKNDSLTWVPVRLYSEADGGIPGPTDSPNEVSIFCYRITSFKESYLLALSSVCLHCPTQCNS